MRRAIQRRRQRPRRRLSYDRLEARQLLATIAGTVFHDQDANGLFSSDEPRLHGFAAYLDLNQNGTHDDTRQSFVSVDVNKPIVDLATTTSTISVSGVTGTLQDLDVRLDIQHTRDGELTITLVSPVGTRQDVVVKVGDLLDDFTHTILDDDAPRSITEADPPFVGRWRPQHPLSAFHGEDPNGTWRLEIRDDTAGNPGTLLSWGLDVANVRTEPAALTNIDGQFQFNDVRPGTYTVRLARPSGWSQSLPADGYTRQLASDTVSLGNNFGMYQPSGNGQIQGTVWNDQNGDGQRDAQESGLAQWQLYLDANNNGVFDKQPTEFLVTVEQPIPDENTLQSPLTVSGLTAPLVDVNLHFNVQHTFVSDLIGYLISPAGTRVEMFTWIGGRGLHFIDTILDDEAEIPASDWVAPFTGSFRPAAPLTAFDGEDGNGVWTFEITDTEAFDQGVLIDWSLEISTSDSPGEPSAVTSAAGDYAFSNLPPDQYTVRQIVVAGWEQTFPAGGAGQTVSVPPTDPVMGVLFGNHQRGAPPTVLAVEFNTDQTDPPDLPAGMQPTSWQRQRSDLRSIQVTFDRAVVATVADLQLTNLGIDADAEPDTPIMLTDDHLTVDGPRLTISFAAYQLPDGVFALQIQETVTDLTGLPLDGDGDGQGGDAYRLQGDMNNGFYKLAGDFNGDHGNSIFDFPTLAYWFGQSVGPAGAPAYLDLNDDQGVTIFDFSRFAAKFNTIVQFPTALRSTALPGPTNDQRLAGDTISADDERQADRRSSDETGRGPDTGRWHDAVRWPKLALDRDRRDSGTIRRDIDLSTYIQALDQWLAEGG